MSSGKIEKEDQDFKEDSNSKIRWLVITVCRFDELP